MRSPLILLLIVGLLLVAMVGACAPLRDSPGTDPSRDTNVGAA